MNLSWLYDQSTHSTVGSLFWIKITLEYHFQHKMMTFEHCTMQMLKISFSVANNFFSKLLIKHAVLRSRPVCVLWLHRGVNFKNQFPISNHCTIITFKIYHWNLSIYISIWMYFCIRVITHISKVCDRNILFLPYWALFCQHVDLRNQALLLEVEQSQDLRALLLNGTQRQER